MPCYDGSMPNRSSRSNKSPGEVKQLAASIVDAASDDEPQAESAAPGHQKDPLAVELGRRGGKKGGAARAAKLTAEQRREIAKKAAEARWAGER